MHYALQEWCAQPLPIKAVNHSGLYDKHNCPQRNSIPAPHTLQSGMLPLDHCNLLCWLLLVEKSNDLDLSQLFDAGTLRAAAANLAFVFLHFIGISD